MKTIGFIGLGLIGGSIAKAIRKYHPDYHILAYNRSKEALASAISTGIIDGVCEEMKDPRFGSCDYVFLCAPVEINLECLAYLKEIRQPGCIITDVGSVKGIIHQKVDELGMTDCFIGGHPMAGSAHSGKCILYSYPWRGSGTGIYFRFYRADQFSWCYPYGAYS